jgi:hypothetical protein
MAAGWRPRDVRHDPEKACPHAMRGEASISEKIRSINKDHPPAIRPGVEFAAFLA